MVTMKEMTEEFQAMPSKLSIVALNTLDASAVVNGRLGDCIDETITTTYFWFRSQKIFKRVTIRDANGISVTFENLEKLTTTSALIIDPDCKLCNGTGLRKDPLNPHQNIPCSKCARRMKETL